MTHNKIRNHTIHYCWFGKSPLPELSIKCIESWRRFFPGWEIKRWDESNYDIHKCAYLEEAYRAKKWAFVSDYARFDILYSYGGVYFDTDVEVIKSFDDIIEAGPFMGLELHTTVAPGLGLGTNPGLGLGTNPGLGLFKEILEMYEKRHFIRKDGSFDQMTIVTFTTKILISHGFQQNTINSNIIQNINGISIYPPDYFCPMNYMTGKIIRTNNTRSIHYYSASWHTGFEKIAVWITKKTSQHNKFVECIGYIISLFCIFCDKMHKIGIKRAMKSSISYIIKIGGQLLSKRSKYAIPQPSYLCGIA